MEAIRPSSLQLIDIRCDLIVPNEANVNEMDDATFARLVEEIEDVGFIDPLQVIQLDNGTYKLIGGEHRWKAAQRVGMTHVPCTVLTDTRWTDEDFADLVMFRLNMLHGGVNSDKFVQYYERMTKKFGETNLQYILAITSDQQWKKMKKGVVAQLKKSGLPEELMREAEEAEKSSRSPEDFGKRLSNIFDKYSKTANSNYLIFQQGSKEHIMIHSSVENYAAIKRIAEVCGESGRDVNEVLQPILAQAIQAISM